MDILQERVAWTESARPSMQNMAAPVSPHPLAATNYTDEISCDHPRMASTGTRLYTSMSVVRLDPKTQRAPALTTKVRPDTLAEIDEIADAEGHGSRSRVARRLLETALDLERSSRSA